MYKEKLFWKRTCSHRISSCNQCLKAVFSYRTRKKVFYRRFFKKELNYFIITIFKLQRPIFSIKKYWTFFLNRSGDASETVETFFFLCNSYECLFYMNSKNTKLEKPKFFWSLQQKFTSSKKELEDNSLFKLEHFDFFRSDIYAHILKFWGNILGNLLGYLYNRSKKEICIIWSL